MHPMRMLSVIILLLVLSLVTSACGSAPTQAVDFTKVTPEVVVLIPTTPPAPTLIGPNRSAGNSNRGSQAI